MAARGEPKINSDRCKGCGLCIAHCPQNILEMSQGFNVQGVTFPVLNDNDSCTACTFCATMCPESAIEIYRFALPAGGSSEKKPGVVLHG